MPAVRHSIFSSLIFFSVTACADSPMSLMEAGVTSAYKSMTPPISPEVVEVVKAPEPSTPPQRCSAYAKMIQAGLRHIEGKGIGYNHGYTTLELLIRPASGDYSIFPFFDLRGHIFDDGKFASNVGVGFRARTASRIWGFNTYYDYRRTHKYRYNQIGAGFETLGKIWDFRLNGYLPVGTHESRWYGLKFDKFKGHSLLLKRKQEFAMTGVDGEIGAHLRKGCSPDFYAATGPYYFNNKDQHALGAKARLGAKWKDYFSLEVSGSYDNLFHGIVQGEIGFYLPLGPKSEAKRKGCCSNFKTLMDRMIREPVVRDEIIVVDKRRKSFVARDPASGDPYVFWFVNNQSHSNGTFESPFPLLNSAIGVSNPNDIFYIFPGDGTSTGLDAGAGTFQLQNNQQLWGAGVTQFIKTQFGTVKVPHLATGLPLLTGTSGIITVANNNKISGLHLFVAGGAAGMGGIGIGLASGPSVNNLTVTNSQFDVPNSSKGISSSLIGGVISISNNLFSSSGSGITMGAGIDLEPTNINAFCTVINNTVLANGNPSFSAISFMPTNSNLTSIICENIINGSSIAIIGTGSGVITSTIQNNSLSTSLPLNNGGIVIASTLIGSSIQLTSTITSNTINGGTNGIFIITNTPFAKSIIQNNNVTNATNQGIIVEYISGLSAIAEVSSNIVTHSGLRSGQIIGALTNSCCVRFQNNEIPSDFRLWQQAGTYYLEPLLGNIPDTFTKLGNITNVPQGFCGN